MGDVNGATACANGLQCVGLQQAESFPARGFPNQVALDLAGRREMVANDGDDICPLVSRRAFEKADCPARGPHRLISAYEYPELLHHSNES